MSRHASTSKRMSKVSKTKSTKTVAAGVLSFKDAYSQLRQRANSDSDVRRQGKKPQAIRAARARMGTMGGEGTWANQFAHVLGKTVERKRVRRDPGILVAPSILPT